jgi:NAD(P)-dependent dehydrogenase (short-subunit alcohol dehydrogenase family)
MNLKLENKTALVTGSTAGIGFAIALGLAREGARVIINGRTQKRVDKALSAIRKEILPGAKLEGIAEDLGTAAGCEALVRKLPSVDILVNNLGIFEPKPFEQIPDADWQRLFEVNVMSGVRLGRAYLPGMKERNWGRVVFISSESGVHIPAEMVHYGMTKTAQLAIARGMAETCAGTNVTVNSVLPGPTASEGVTAFVGKLAKEQKLTPAEFEKEFFKTMRPTSLIKRFLRPEEVANVVVFACSPEASAINGAAMRAEGGLVKACV